MRILQKISLLLLGCLAMTVFTDNVFAEVGDDSDLNTVVEGNSAFALDLYAKLGKKQGNLFFSPYSISTALGMVYGGARGNTEKQMAEVLHFTLAQKQFHPAFARLEARLNADQKSEDIDLNIANALWIQKDYSILKNFLDLLKTNYQAGPRPVDFIRAPEDARKKINAWVEEATKAKIKDLIKAGVLGPMIRLVLVNAIYFKGNWSSRFEKRLTQAAPFRME
ncbi:serpin family protein, partial [bacterium]|nr:serpin family protein [bacterium]